MIRLSNYKLEVENTEKLKGDITSAFSEINSELKKDDNLIASDLFDVDKKIEELKKSRKKWASGEAVPKFLENGRDGYIIIKPELRFIAKNVFIKVTYGKYDVKRTYDIQPFSAGNNSYSSVYLIDSSTADDSNAQVFKIDDYTFVDFRNKNASNNGEKVRDLQLSLNTNEFVVSHGNNIFISDIVANNKIKITYIAFE